MPKTTITTSIRDLVPGDRVFLANRLQRDHHGIVIALHTDRQGVTSVIVKHLSGHYAGQRAVITSFERETFEVMPASTEPRGSELKIIECE